MWIAHSLEISEWNVESRINESSKSVSELIQILRLIEFEMAMIRNQSNDNEFWFEKANQLGNAIRQNFDHEQIFRF